MSARVKGCPDAPSGEKPRWSNVITRYPAAVRAGTWCARHTRPGAPVPVTITTGSPAPYSSYPRLIPLVRTTGMGPPPSSAA